MDLTTSYDYLRHEYDLIDLEVDLNIEQEKKLDVNDPMMNYSRIYRELRRIEGHLTDPWMYCDACLYKHSADAKSAMRPLYDHTTSILDLTREASTLDIKGKYIKLNTALVKVLRPLPKRFAQAVRQNKKVTDKERHTILQQVRSARKMITEVAMDADIYLS